MAKIVVIKERCKGCQICVSVCPRECLKISEEHNQAGYFVVELVSEEKCTGCGVCGEMCPDLALQIWR